ncbi:hypothetical protein SKAU_G00200560 [Synaphobranchus kaupii]|uniref:Uncharacterized protein n=1 Tax=Synaphobranchus kaupii TaxID=118154 RepID=A0A9Q1IW20_SYNKA|nr:hypothetical protein SKAU_G00200560 [Synaphobranchus kaupii]
MNDFAQCKCRINIYKDLERWRQGCTPTRTPRTHEVNSAFINVSVSALPLPTMHWSRDYDSGLLLLVSKMHATILQKA